MRLIIFLAAVYLGFKLLKSILKKKFIFKDVSSSGRNSLKTGAKKIDDVMVQDPFCKVYFPKRDGIHIKIKGEDLFFCSNTCKEKYLDQIGDK